MKQDPENSTEHDFTKPRLLRRRDMKLSWGEGPATDTPGSRRGLYTEIVAHSSAVRLVVFPVGQGRPRHRNSGEHIHYQISSSMEFTIAAEKYRVDPGDLLFIPANVDYELVNVGDVDALVLHVLSKVSEWPPSAVFPDTGVKVVRRGGQWVEEPNGTTPDRK